MLDPRICPVGALTIMIPLLSPQPPDRTTAAFCAPTPAEWPHERLWQGAFVLLVVLWPWIGLFGREPWKPDEAYSFGLVWSMVQGKGLIVPLLAGEPFLEKPPLFYWVAAAFAQLLRGWLPPHEAARLAIPFFMYLTFGFFAATSRELYGNRRALLALALFVGGLGVFDKVHMLITDVALVAGLSIGYFGIVVGHRRPLVGGLALGLGAGIAFMSKGLLGPGLLALTVAILLCFRSWRIRLSARLLGLAIAAASPLLLAWPLALYVESPQSFRIWLWDNNLGRFLGFVRLGESHGAWFYPVTLLWFAFPLWPLAIWAGAAAYRQRAGTLPLQLAMVGFAVTLAVLIGAHQSRALYALPLVLPLSLAAVAGIEHAPRWAATALRRGSIVVFESVAVVLWGLWAAAVSGFSPLATILAQREPGFVAAFSIPAVVVAAIATMLFAASVRGPDISAQNAVRAWTAGLSTCWALLMTLWLPYLDYGMAYRSLASALEQVAPRDGSCIASRGLGEPQRAMFDYYAAIVTRRLEIDPGAQSCPWLLVQQTGSAPTPPASGRWAEIWRGTRPGDGRENFYLFRRIGAG
ncbi:MAG TPA: glycosyltransferase family 39 protein [Casimicrobiaceae bacterium]